MAIGALIIGDGRVRFEGTPKQVINDPGDSAVEDVISIYKSSGVPDSRPSHASHHSLPLRSSR